VKPIGLAAAAFLFDEAGRVLLILENYGHRRFGPPGGRVEPGESPAEAAVRETREEVGIEIGIDHLVGVRTWEDSYRRRWLGFAFRAEILGGEPTIASPWEIADVGWFDPAAPPQPLTRLAERFLLPASRGERGLVES